MNEQRTAVAPRGAVSLFSGIDAALTGGWWSALLAALGVGQFVWALLEPGFRDAEGMWTGRICLPFAIALALLTIACSLRSPAWRNCGFWTALSVSGQAVSLQLIDAGKWIHFQHYQPLIRLLERFPWHLAFVAAQLVAVVAAFRSPGVLHPVRDWVRSYYRPWALGLVLIGIVMGSATLSRRPADYVAELAFSTLITLLNCGSIFLASFHFPRTALPAATCWIGKFLGDDTVLPLRRERVVLGGAVWVTTASALLALFVYQCHPHVADEVMYLFHARYLAEGRLTVDAPPVPEAFSLYLAQVENGRMYASPPAAWPLVLAIGVLAGVPWLVNPVLGGLNIVLAFLLCRNVIGARYARLAVVLLCASPWFVFMCMNFMTHTLTMTCVLVAALGLTHAGRTGHSRWAWLAGAAVGYTSLIRPLDGLLLAVILGLLAIGVGGRRVAARSFAGLIVGAALVGALVLPYNWYLTGNPAQFPLNRYIEQRFWPGVNNLGFGPEKGLPFGEGMDAFPGHGLGDVIANGLLNLAGLSTELHGWACGSLVVVWLLVFSGRMVGRDRWMLSAIILTFLGFSTYWFSGGPDFGARYWYLMLLPLIMLTIGGIRYLEETTGQSTRVLVAALALAALSVANYMPWRALDKYYHYLLMRPDIPGIARGHRIKRDLVIVRGSEHPDYSSAWIHNPLRWDADAPVYASLPRQDLRDQLVRAFPGRRIWLFNGPTVTKSGYRVSGPMTAEQFLAMEAQPR